MVRAALGEDLDHHVAGNAVRADQSLDEVELGRARGHLTDHLSDPQVRRVELQDLDQDNALVP